VQKIRAGAEDEDEQQMFESALQGDLQAFAKLLQFYRPRLKVYLSTKIYGVLRQRFDDSDVIQELAIQGPGKEASVEYLRRLGPFRSVQLLAGRRLYEMARTHFDVEKRDPRREQHLENDESRVFGLAEMLADSMLSPSKYLQHAEAVLNLHKGLGELSAGDRQILEGVHFEGLTRGEIAERLGIEEGAARQRYSRALMRLSEIVKRYDSEDSAGGPKQ
jgi:RNA polymerase sigma-70 factor (ECF subfamily)